MYRTYLPVIVAFLLAAPPAAFGQGGDTTPVGVAAGGAAPAAASAPPPSPHTKSPVVATLLSVVIPGGGQMYAGKVGKGLGLLGLVSAEALVGVGLLVCDVTQIENPNGSHCGGGTGAKLVAIAMIGTWGYGVVSAPFDATEYNERQRKRTGWVRPIVQFGSMDRSGRVPNRVGLMVELPTGW